jgi:hypothetical protein
LIASKFIYRWRATKELARESQEKQERTERAEGKALQAVLSDNSSKTSSKQYRSSLIDKKGPGGVEPTTSAMSHNVKSFQGHLHNESLQSITGSKI